ncbi:MAG: HepT-like ribonuclease domain-containing protein [Elainellaceae cyanobacterium]
MTSPKTDTVRLRHMLDAAQKAIQFTQGCSRQDLNDSEMLALAIVRLVEILGEAAKNVSRTYALTNSTSSGFIQLPS